MKSFVKEHFDRFLNQQKPCIFNSFFKQQLLADLNKCNTLQDVYLLHEFVRQNHQSFDFGELVEMQLQLNHRICLLEYIKKNLFASYYSYYEFREMVQKTKSVLVCQALQLHTEIFRDNYLRQHSQVGLAVFAKLINDKIQHLTLNYHD